jgi:hypothetical protein
MGQMFPERITSTGQKGGEKSRTVVDVVLLAKEGCLEGK